MSAGCLPGSTWSDFTFSSAFGQSSPQPSSREASRIRSSHQANSRSAAAISSSGE